MEEVVISFFFSFYLLGHAQHVEVSRLGVKVGATAAGLHHRHSNAKTNLVCDLYHSSRQHWILNPLSKARDPTHVLMDTNLVHYH